MRHKLTMLGSCGVPLHTASNVITDLCWQLCMDLLLPLGLLYAGSARRRSRLWWVQAKWAPSKCWRLWSTSR